MSNPNSHVQDYLKYYLELPRPPHFAVLLSGVWGSGKTFQARRIVNELLGDAYLFVSLNGLSTRKELDDTLFAAVYPWTQSREARIGTAIGKALLKHAKIELPDIDKAEIAAQAGIKVLIFDDLERCLLPIGETLGYINDFVERDGRYVIVIADETKIPDCATYATMKEKVIGKTLSIAADFDAALAYFANLPENESTKAVLLRFQPEIEQIYIQSGLQNLRILEHSMADFTRLYCVLEERHVTQGAAMRHLLKLFFAFSFELKAGRISGDDLSDRVHKIVIGMMKDNDPTPMSAANSRYAGVELSDSILSDEVLFDVLVRGFIDGSRIRSTLDASSWFVQGDEPSWREVWYSFERDDAETKAAAERMVADFKERKFQRSGEVLHLFGQMLWLADIGVSGWDRSETIRHCKRYVDDLRSSGRIESILQRREDGIDYGAFGGLTFSERETPEFQQLWEYMIEQRRLADVDRFPDEARRLAELAISDPMEFTRQIAFGRESSARFAEVPVFATLDVDDFAERLIALPPLHLKEVLLAFSLRYDMSALSNRLAQEREWAESLHRRLLEQAEKLGPFGKDRVSKLIDWSIGKELVKLEPVAAAEGAKLDNQ